MSIDDAESKFVQRADIISRLSPSRPRAMAQRWFQRTSGLKTHDKLRSNRFARAIANRMSVQHRCLLRPPARIIFDVDDNSTNAVNISGHAPERDKHRSRSLPRMDILQDRQSTVEQWS